MGLSYDPEVAVAHLRAGDAVLARIVDAIGPLTLEPRDGAFRMLSRAIFFQQLAGPAARAILGRVLATLGADEDNWYAPAQLLAASDEQLRAAGLSRQKMVYLRDLADKFASGDLSEGILHEFDDEEVIKRVSAVKGIGRWTGEMFLIFSLGRPDVLPVDDLGVRRGMQIAYGLADLPKPDEMRMIGEPWRPYRSAGTWYMWRSLGVALPEQGR
ncbi:MAG TPA: DNA-3-methyladenine glycosylase 2 family protein [Dehalococcoidia bacterium]|jgi:3-methyladenine DNA glycosylase/8-oxoguanine DNA glycosylase|nr:DNA-3-methyladenine glycosylase 2 family protein [Dehalococcoidia bacterium]